MTRARNLSRLANPNVLSVDSSNNVGINSTIPDAKLDVIGIVSATSFSGNLTGDATGLTGSPDITINNLVGVAATFSGAADFNGAIDVDGHTELDDVNVSGAITATTFTGNLTGDASGTAGGLTGTPDITVRNITGVAATFTGEVTYEDVTNIDSVGIVTARGGFKIGAAGVGGTITAVGNAEFAGITTVSTLKVGTAATINSSGLDVVGIASVGVAITMYASSGIVSATKFSGPGNIPGNVTTGTYSLVAADAGKLVSATGTVTLPADTFDVGDAISVYNNTGSDMTLTCSAPTAVYLGSDGSTVTSLTLALRCICTFVCVDTTSNDSFVATGGGLS